MASKQYSMWLSEEAAQRITASAKKFGGSVGGYASNLATEMSRLPAADHDEVWDIINGKIKRLEVAGILDAPPPPLALPQQRGEGEKLHAQVSRPHPQTPRRQPQKGKRAGRDAAPLVAV